MEPDKQRKDERKRTRSVHTVLFACACWFVLLLCLYGFGLVGEKGKAGGFKDDNSPFPCSCFSVTCPTDVKEKGCETYLGVLVGLDAVPWFLGSRLVDDNIRSVGEAVADVATRCLLNDWLLFS
jgi:hypothetical protein